MLVPMIASLHQLFLPSLKNDDMPNAVLLTSHIVKSLGKIGDMCEQEGGDVHSYFGGFLVEK